MVVMKMTMITMLMNEMMLRIMMMRTMMILMNWNHDGCDQDEVDDCQQEDDDFAQDDDNWNQENGDEVFDYDDNENIHLLTKTNPCLSKLFHKCFLRLFPLKVNMIKILSFLQVSWIFLPTATLMIFRILSGL